MVGQPLFAMAVITLGLEIAIRPFNLDAVAITGRSVGVPWGTETWEIGGAIFPKSYLAAVIAAAISYTFVAWFYRVSLRCCHAGGRLRSGSGHGPGHQCRSGLRHRLGHRAPLSLRSLPSSSPCRRGRRRAP